MKGSQYRIDRIQLAQTILELEKIEIEKSKWPTSKEDSGRVHESLLEICNCIDKAKVEFDKLVTVTIAYFEKIKLSEEKNEAIAQKAIGR